MPIESRQALLQRLWSVLEPVAAGAGFEIVDIEYIREKVWIVRVYADRPNLSVIAGLGVEPGKGISLDECGTLSQLFSASLDVEDFIPHAYHLEVSSPGVQRPLRKPVDFQRFLGFPLRVKTLEPILSADPKVKVPSRNLVGTLRSASEDAIDVEMNGSLYAVPLSLIQKAYLDPDMDAWLRLASNLRDETEATEETDDER